MNKGNPAAKKFIPDLLPGNIIIEVVKIHKDGSAEKKEMEYRVWKEMKKQKDFTYRAYQKGISSFNLKK